MDVMKSFGTMVCLGKSSSFQTNIRLLLGICDTGFRTLVHLFRCDFFIQGYDLILALFGDRAVGSTASSETSPA